MHDSARLYNGTLTVTYQNKGHCFVDRQTFEQTALTFFPRHHELENNKQIEYLELDNEYH